MNPPPPNLTHDDYNIAFICPTGIELAAVEGMMDEIHPALLSTIDKNSYTYGRIGAHNIVVAVLPERRNNQGASVATQLNNDFRSLRFSLLTETGGGIPDHANDRDIRLGDVVVSKPTETFGGVVQLDRGKSHAHGRFERTGIQQRPPDILLSTVQRLDALHMRVDTRIPVFIDEMLARYPKMKKTYVHQGGENDLLFRTEYDHGDGKHCGHCDMNQVIERVPRDDSIPVIHHGTIGSSKTLLRNSVRREILRDDFDILCVETEAATLMNEIPCLAVCGISDYADSHSNVKWQPYAAATAAAYAKELLSLIPPLKKPAKDNVKVASFAPRQQAPAIRTSTMGKLIHGPVAGDLIAGSKLFSDGVYDNGRMGRWVYD
ncbi:purine and uridine phosphorylase [Aspergillus vadensis CBS 113365]|uniref:Purine and uridine phosphorylase n=1 Tax=Aspergillus vadensis (strain CBS 113365 / IMI 142717 / IBT 24658) TaxID=1448311 RepID=A0A319AXF4_ASPVC|nr:purine and uridine phosphorylase [Aspergillus vadensis CBS 113365]PYH64294.1 purine and uridine phosphorylase [Aspergillus vadensis CBS 113365]